MKPLYALMATALFFIVPVTAQTPTDTPEPEPAVTLHGTLNSPGLENDALFSAGVTLEDGLVLIDAEWTDIVSLESAAFDGSGGMVITVDLAMNAENTAVTAGGLIFSSGYMSDSPGETRLVAGENTGIVSPKGLQVLETLGVVAIADNGAKDVKLFALDAEGDAAPVAVLPLGGEGGGVWDVWYDILNDTLYAAKTNGELAAYDTFSETMGADGPDRIITLTDESGAQISVNLHGIDVDYDTNTVILSDIGDSAVNTDGQIFVLLAVSISDGPTLADGRLSGNQTLLGNPVDLIFDGNGIFVAEKLNDSVLYFADILAVSGEVNRAPDMVAAAVKAESVAIYPTRESRMIEDMGLMDEG